MRADIHDDPEHNRSKQRSDTLMQDRICRIDENLLHRAAGPYIWVTSAILTIRPLLPVFPENRTSPVPVATSQTGRQQTIHRLC